MNCSRMEDIMKKRIIALALALGLLTSLTACGGSSDSGSASSESGEAGTQLSADGEELAQDQTLNVLLLHNVSTLDINNTGWTSEQQIIYDTQEGLLRLKQDEDGNEYYDTAGCESYDVSEDGLVYTFHLRDNHWSDGEPVTAQNYVDSYVRELTASNGFPNVSHYQFVKNGEAFYEGNVTADELGVKALDDKTLEVTLEDADINVLNKFAASGFPIRQDLIDAATVEYGTQISEMAFSGPFIVESWTPDNSMVLKKNPNYWDADNIILETVNLSYVAETGTQATLFDSQQLDIVEYNTDYADQWNAQAEAGEITAIVQPKSQVRWVIYNQNGKSGLMGNTKVRLALSLSINRQDFLDAIFGGRYYPAWDFTPATITVEGKEYNSLDGGTIKDLQAEYDTPDKLQALLKEGLDEARYSYSDLKDVVIQYTDKADNTLDQARIEYLKQTWESVLGITVNTEITSDFDYMTGDYDVTLATWTSNSPYASLRLFEENAGIDRLNGFYEDEEIQGWFDEAKGVLDADEYIRIYKQIEDKLVSTAVVAPIYWGDSRYFQQNYVQGIIYRKLGTEFDMAYAYILAH